jgi:hypothetical protein
MSYQTTVNIIRDIANAVNTEGRFIHGRRIDASQSYDGMYPLIVMYPFQSIEKGSTVESSLLIGFFKQDSTDSSPEQREEIIQEMYELSKAFTDALFDIDVASTTDLIKEPQYQMYQGTMSGYAVKFTFTIPLDCNPDE